MTKRYEKTLTLIAKDNYGRIQAELKVGKVSKLNHVTGCFQTRWNILSSHGADFGNQTAFLELPVGRAQGIINYSFGIHWTEMEEEQ